MPACPHALIQYCPLYVAAHEPHGLGCVTDLAEPCLVARGANYAAMVAKLDQRMVAILKFREEAAEASEQRRRNMRLNGIQ